MPDMDPHVQAAVYGTPKINPDEQNHYLGTFRERIYVAQTRATFGDTKYMPTWETQLKEHKNATLLLNGHLDMELLTPYIKLASKYNVGFTLKSDDVYDRSDVVAVLTAKEAVNITQIDVVALTLEDDEEKTGMPDAPQKPWYKKLFG